MADITFCRALFGPWPKIIRPCLDGQAVPVLDGMYIACLELCGCIVEQLDLLCFLPFLLQPTFLLSDICLQVDGSLLYKVSTMCCKISICSECHVYHQKIASYTILILSLFSFWSRVMFWASFFSLSPVPFFVPLLSLSCTSLVCTYAVRLLYLSSTCHVPIGHLWCTVTVPGLYLPVPLL